MLDFVAGGGVGDGITPNDALLSAAYSALPANGGDIYFGPGKFKFTGAVGYAFPNAAKRISLKGAGEGATTFHWPTASDGLVFQLVSQANAVNISDITFTTGVPNGGTALVVYNRSSNPSYVYEHNNLTRLTFHGSDGVGGGDTLNYWTNGIYSESVNGINFESIIVNGAYIVGTGISLASYNPHAAIVYNFSKCSFSSLETGVAYGSRVQGVTVGQSNFVGCNRGIAAFAGGVEQVQLAVSTSQFDCFRENILTDSGIADTLLSNNLFYSQDLTGNYPSVSLAKACRFIIGGNSFKKLGSAGNSKAIRIGQTLEPGIIMPNNISGYNRGVELSNLSSGVLVHLQNYQSTATKILNSGTGNIICAGP